MLRSALVRLVQRPGLLGGLLFLATMGLAAALAWQAAGAAASHRAAAEASLTHHATIAAWRFSREGRSWVGYGMGQAGRPAHAGDVPARGAARAGDPRGGSWPKRNATA